MTQETPHYEYKEAVPNDRGQKPSLFGGDDNPLSALFDVSNDRGQEPYLPGPDLVEAVNLAIALRRPLLLKGEPGCGKTRLAPDVARQLPAPALPRP
jgi:hypothetical protein